MYVQYFQGKVYLLLVRAPFKEYQFLLDPSLPSPFLYKKRKKKVSRLCVFLRENEVKREDRFWVFVLVSQPYFFFDFSIPLFLEFPFLPRSLMLAMKQEKA